MVRKLKTFQTSLGFYDLAIAAPSMKAALEAWGAGSNLFHQGIAAETSEPAVVAATMAKPGVVLKRPAGSTGHFSEHSDIPSQSAADGSGKTSGDQRLRAMAHAIRHEQQGEVALMSGANGLDAVRLATRNMIADNLRILD